MRILLGFALFVILFAHLNRANAQDSTSETIATESEIQEPEEPKSETLFNDPDIEMDDEEMNNVVMVQGDSKWRLSGRVEPRYELTHIREWLEEDEESITNSFLIRRARLKVAWEPNETVRTVLNLGLDQVTDIGSGLLKDAYIHLNLAGFFKIRFGQFKKPFSGLELRSSRKLKVLERGLGNDLIIEELRYGDRDLGIRLSGRIIKSIKLDYAVGVFNGSGPNVTDSTNSKDIAGRLELRPIKALRFGANGSYKFFDDSSAGDRSVWAAGGDIRISLWGVRLFVEALTAQNHLRGNETVSVPFTFAFDLISVLSYRYSIPVSWGFDVEPVVKAELIDQDTDMADDDIWVVGPGLNLYFGEYLRLMAQGEFMRGKRNSHYSIIENYADSDVFMLQLCFNI